MIILTVSHGEIPSSKKVRIPKSGYSFVAMPVSPGSVLTQKIFLEPLDSDVIFGLGTIARIEIESRAMFIDGEEQSLSLKSLPKG